MKTGYLSLRNWSTDYRSGWDRSSGPLLASRRPRHVGCSVCSGAERQLLRQRSELRGLSVEQRPDLALVYKAVALWGHERVAAAS